MLPGKFGNTGPQDKLWRAGMTLSSKMVIPKEYMCIYVPKEYMYNIWIYLCVMKPISYTAKINTTL